MGKLFKGRRAIAVGAGVVAAAVVFVAIMVSLARGNNRPTLYLEGAEIKKVTNEAGESSTQMIVTVSLDNVRASGGFVVMMEANSKYITPSDFDTNELVVNNSSAKRLDADRIYRVHTDIYDRENDPTFNEDDVNDLYYPFYPYSTGENGELEAGVSVITMDSGNAQIEAVIEPTSVIIDNAEYEREAKQEDRGNNVWSFDISEGDYPVRQKYIQAEEKTRFVQFSFQVKEDKLTEMIQTFNGKADKGENGRGGYFDTKNRKDDFLLRVDLEGDTYGDEMMGNYYTCALPFWEFWDEYVDPNHPQFYAPIGSGWDDLYGPFETSVEWKFEDMLIDAVSAKKDVTINAYQAYGNGTPLDVADALLRYSPAVRGTHVLDGRLEDFTMFWGGADGCDIEDVSTGYKYHLTRTFDDNGTADGGYILQQWNKDLKKWETTTDTSWYSPKGGEYNISQMFWYDLGLGKEPELYPEPIRVHLTVTPITVVDVTAQGLNKTYYQIDASKEPKAPNHYDGLGLPGTAQIVTDIVPGQVSLTIPIETWTSTKAPATKLDDLAGKLHGTKSNDPDDGTDVVWDEVGYYRLNALPPYYDGDNSALPQPSFGEAVICAFYPWLTVDKAYKLEATRRIVDESTTVIPEFEVYFGETEDDSGELTLKVAKKVGGSYVYMAESDTYTFQLMLPNGTVIDDSFAHDGTNGKFSWKRQSSPDPKIDNKNGYDITLKAKTLGSQGGDEVIHEMVRRSINLGGYFHVEVTENPGQDNEFVSEFISRYVGPRTNIYNYSYISNTDTDDPRPYFDFTGVYHSLYPFYLDSVLPPYVSLPTGYYVETRYDGNTGAEPGLLNAFAVDGWDHQTPSHGTKSADGTQWVPDSEDPPMTIAYGYQDGDYDPFATTYNYSGFGKVENKREKEVRMDVQVQPTTRPEPTEEEKKKEKEAIRLTYEDWGDAVTTTATGEVQRVIFDDQQVGYVYRQTVTLTLTNIGDTTIDGIYVDAAGGLDCIYGGERHSDEFIITQQPASSLPAGASTTFTVSYIFDLGCFDQDKFTHEAGDSFPIRIYSDHYPASGVPLKTFEAEITITNGELYHLYVITQPFGGVAGTAGPVVGPQGTPGAVNTTPLPSTFTGGTDVWLLAHPEENYSVVKIYWMDGAQEMQLGEYRPPNVDLPDVEDVMATFKMPYHDFVVYVVFDESVYSRMRLIDIQDWSGPSKPNSDPNAELEPGELTHQLPLMLHEIDDTDADAGVVTYNYPHIREDGEDGHYKPYAPAPGTNPPRDLKEPDAVIQLTEDEYLVVIPADADWSQVRLILRDIEDMGFKPEIDIMVDTLVYHMDVGITPQPDDYTKHTSRSFNSPDPGKQKRAVITLTHTEDYLVNAETKERANRTIQREYTLIIARRFDFDQNNPLKYPLNYGNSPYGMIEWDEDIDKKEAKKAYDENDRFAEGYIPAVAEEKGLSLTYWQQAWSGLGVNYDRDDEALFVFAGQAFEDFGPVEGKVTNSAGDVVENKKITRTLTGLLTLDSAYTNQKTQFASPKKVEDVLDLGTADVPLVKADIWGEYLVRPGVYRLQYSYTDFDGETIMVFYRPLIVLNQLGDLDQDGARAKADAKMLEGRIDSALGYEAVGPNNPYVNEAPLYRSRVCDVNNDRNINQIDANTVYSEKVKNFYLPVGYSGQTVVEGP